MIMMRIEIIEDHIDVRRIGVQHINQITHRVGKVLFGPSSGDQHMPLTGFRVCKDKQVARAIPLVFMVFPPWFAGTSWAGLAGLTQ